MLLALALYHGGWHGRIHGSTVDDGETRGATERMLRVHGLKLSHGVIVYIGATLLDVDA